MLAIGSDIDVKERRGDPILGPLTAAPAALLHAWAVVPPRDHLSNLPFSEKFSIEAPWGAKPSV